MTHYLRRRGHQVAFCTVDRLMTSLGMNGIRRGKPVRTGPGDDPANPTEATPAGAAAIPQQGGRGAA